jgi:hypothetical protein
VVSGGLKIEKRAQQSSGAEYQQANIMQPSGQDGALDQQQIKASAGQK